ncbi:MAG: S-layer homology domain-containing protein [Clostridia bacterium]|nr:S-layer homology domain-containing protein [Clostridia bacterium]
MKNRIRTMAAVAALCAMSLSAFAADFSDVKDDAWYAECVDYVTDNGLFDAQDDGNFAPESEMTRGMLVTAIGRLEGVEDEEKKNVFLDIPQSAVCRTYANWAAENGIVDGYDGAHFGPYDSLTREQMAKVFYNYLKYKKANTKVQSVMDYVDADKVSDWAVNAVSYCSEQGLIEGNEKHEFVPQGTLTRAEAAQVVYKLAKNFVKEKTESITGTVMDINDYGHATTDILVKEFVSAGFTTGDFIQVHCGDVVFIAPYATAYNDVDNDSNVILSVVDNTHISVAINMGNASDTYGIKEGDTLTFTMYEKGGYDAELELRSSYIYTNQRSDYPSDEAFANFREITAGDIKEGRLYRSSTPLKSDIGRDEYAAKLIEAAGIKTAINLSDADMESVKSEENYEGSYYSKIAIYPSRINLDVTSDSFKTNAAAALRNMILAEKPILIHCQQGKERTGLMAAMIEALCGASYEEIIDDYMLSYENYYSIEHGGDQWQHIAEGNIVPSLLKITGAKTSAELEKVDLRATVRAYMMDKLGMMETELDALYDVLCK